MSKILVIGGGWAGLTSAVYLAKENDVTLYEASPNLGGRARSISYKGYQLDNGQHILLGAYQYTLNVLKYLKVNIKECFVRENLELSINKVFFKIKSLPAPFHFLFGILFAKGLNFFDKISILKFSFSLRINKFKIEKDIPLLDFLLQNNQTKFLIENFWEPIALAAMSTPIELCSTEIFLNVMKNSFYAKKEFSDALFPKKDLSNILPNAALSYLNKNNAKVYFHERVTELLIQDNACIGIVANGEKRYFDKVILATPSNVAFNLLKQEDSFEFTPITTLYLIFNKKVSLDKNMQGFIQKKTQWVFNIKKDNILSVVITGEVKKENLLKDVLLEISEFLPNYCHLIDSKIITEKRAAFCCSVSNNKKRPSMNLDVQNLYLAGNYVQTGYPATIEGAVLSGFQCAQSIIKES